MAKKQKPEAQVQRAVLDYLRAEKILHFRQNSGVLLNKKGRPVRFGEPGMADIQAFPRVKVCMGAECMSISHPLWIECKSPVGSVSPQQEEFRRRVESEGHTYIVVRSLDDLLVWLDHFKAAK